MPDYRFGSANVAPLSDTALANQAALVRRQREEFAQVLKRFERVAGEMYETAQVKLREARTVQEKDHANALLRHARGVILAAGRWHDQVST